MSSEDDAAMSQRCILGSPRSLHFVPRGKGKVSKDYICSTTRGLSCQLCNNYACVYCVMAIRDKMPKRASAYDQWSAFVDDKKQEPLMQGIVRTPQGHYCEWKRHDDAASKATRAKKHVHPKRIHTKYSGYLHYLGCNLLVDSPTNGVIDIHGAHGAGEIGDDSEDKFDGIEARGGYYRVDDLSTSLKEMPRRVCELYSDNIKLKNKKVNELQVRKTVRTKCFPCAKFIGTIDKFLCPEDRKKMTNIQTVILKEL